MTEKEVFEIFEIEEKILGKFSDIIKEEILNTLKKEKKIWDFSSDIVKKDKYLIKKGVNQWEGHFAYCHTISDIDEQNENIVCDQIIDYLGRFYYEPFNILVSLDEEIPRWREMTEQEIKEFKTNFKNESRKEN